MKKRLLKIISFALCLSLTASIITSVSYNEVASPQKTFSLAQAQNLALTGSYEIKKAYNQILLKKMKYVEAVKVLQAKAKNKKTFRWSPLLSFKFPEKFNLIEEFELVMKPVALTAEITTLQHSMNDKRYEVLNKVNKAFFNAYILQEKLNFKEEVLETSKTELERNKARLVLGTANQNDIDVMERSIERLTEEVSQLRRNFQTAKETLTEIVKLDLTSGYRFLHPLQTAEISREYLETIIDYALSNDQIVYEARSAESIARLNLERYEALMRKQYGSKMDAISHFVSAAKNGAEIDYSAFQTKYNEMVKSFDKPWDKEIRILFFSFSFEFFKGQIDGTRYIEDEIYAVYTACMELDGARKERQAAEKDLIKQIRSDFEALVTAKNAALSTVKIQGDTKAQLERVINLNKIGKAEYEEVKEKQDDYRSAQLDALDAAASYNELLSNFDRLTCGAITLMLKGASLDLDAGDGGLSLPGTKPYYYIYNDIADLTFVFGLDIPEDFEPNITHYEIWYEGAQIGERTEVNKRIRHLTLINGDSDFLTVRVFSDNEFIAECEVDVTTPRDVLPLPEAEKAPSAVIERSVGTYKIDTEFSGDVNISKISFDFDISLNAGFYKIVYGETDIYQGELIPVEESFNYLSLMVASLSDLKLLIYDKNGAFLEEAYFDAPRRQLTVNN